MRLQKVDYCFQTSSFPFADHGICLKMGLSLWDEEHRKFFGNTIFSEATGPLNSRRAGEYTHPCFHLSPSLINMTMLVIRVAIRYYKGLLILRRTNF